MPILAAFSGIDYNQGNLERRLKEYEILNDEFHKDYIHSINSYVNGTIGYKIKKDTLDRIRVISLTDSVFYCLGYNEFVDSLRNEETSNYRSDSIIKEIKKSDGEYVLFGIERNGIINVVTDRYASRPCFYVKDQNRIFFSTNILFLKELAEVHIDFNQTGLLELLNFDHCLSGKTTFDQILRVRPAQHLQINEGKVQSKEYYWRAAYRKRTITDIGEFSDMVYAEFKKSVENRTKNRSGFVSLSGGLDSRFVASAIAPDRFHAFTFVDSMGDSNTADVRTSKIVADKLGLNHKIKRLKNPENPVSSQIDKLLRLTGGQTLIYHSTKVNTYIDEMKISGFHLGGGSGDIIAGSHSYSSDSIDLREKFEWVKGLKIVYPQPFVKKYFRQKDLYESLIKSLDNSFSDINESSIAKTTTIWAIKERYSSFTFNSPIHNHPDVSESSPHLGYPFVDLMLMLSTKELYKKNFYKYMIYNRIPGLIDVVYSNTGRLVISDLILQENGYNFSLQNLKKYIDKLHIYLQSAFKKYGFEKKTVFLYDMIRSDRPAIEMTKNLLGRSHALDEILDINTCMDFITGFEAGNIELSKLKDGHFMSFLITVSFLSKLFKIQ